RSYHCWYMERTGTYHVPEQIQGAKHLSEIFSQATATVGGSLPSGKSLAPEYQEKVD
ncbi:hypothetical protein M378DRAFT_167311, partial [Amanita muscaria Koide BX008]